MTSAQRHNKRRDALWERCKAAKASQAGEHTRRADQLKEQADKLRLQGDDVSADHVYSQAVDLEACERSAETRKEWLLRKGWKQGHNDTWLDYLTRRMCYIDKAETLEYERETAMSERTHKMEQEWEKLGTGESPPVEAYERVERERTQHTPLNFKESAEFCDSVREPAEMFAARWGIPKSVAYNAFLEAAGIAATRAERDKLREQVKELLAACKIMVRDSGTIFEDTREKAIAQAEAAIAKAEGSARE